MRKVFLAINIWLVLRVRCDEISNLTFPASFSFGAATASYQVEGGWNASGKGISYFDFSTHNYPYLYANGSNGDIACDSYHQYREDIQLLKNLKASHYRFSIAWTRILPTGFVNQINQDGVDYYNNLIDGLLAEGIEPWVTIFHWDIPQVLQNLGGWTQERLIGYFTDYADLIFSLYGDRVKTWLTINEIATYCYSIVEGLALNDTTQPIGFYEYICSYYALRTHTSVYRLYERKYKKDQKGKVSMPFVLEYYYPATNSSADIEAAERMLQFQAGIYLHPLIYGNYPKVVRDVVNTYSTIQGFTHSRLPAFTPQELFDMIGAVDFIAINHYASFLTIANNSVVNKNPNVTNDYGVITYQDPSWEGEANAWLKMYPNGFRDALVWLKNNYNNPEIVVTEQGLGEYTDELNDTQRIKYYRTYLNAALEAIHVDKVRLTGYTAWGLMDDFEWNSGYTLKFGLYHVDFNSAERTRTPRESAFFYRKVIETRSLI